MKLTSWGMHPKIESKIYDFTNEIELAALLKENKSFIAYGNGRSYGDSALASNVINMRKYNYFLAFDENSGVLHVQSGVLLSEIIEVFLPRGWFLQVTPGTKLITAGGAIASDVHGKNHHKMGAFSSCVEEIRIMLSDGSIQKCYPNNELFKITCGGMGLSGVILDAKIKLKKVNSQWIKQKTIKTKNLKETFEAFEKYQDETYSVAWIDCLASKDEIGKCVLMVGDFCDDGDLNYKAKKHLNIPFTFPSFALNYLSVKAFNKLYYAKAKNSESKVSIDSFFYPLDSIDNWNRIYGKNGFTQYQFILPLENSFDGLKEILEHISNSKKGSFLAVLKLYGKANDNYLSFPLQGYSLALDFKIEDSLFGFLDELDEIVIKHGGRIYLTKDVRVKKEVFEKGYSKIDIFKEFRKTSYNLEKFNSLQSQRLGL